MPGVLRRYFILGTLLISGLVGLPPLAWSPPAQAAPQARNAAAAEDEPSTTPWERLEARTQIREPRDFVDASHPRAMATLTPPATDRPLHRPALAAANPIPAQVRNLAKSLGNDPTRIFEYVLNNLNYEPYYLGLVKGSVETLWEKGGNDYDLAALLVDLLRSGDTPARFVRRRIQVSAAVAQRWIGVTDALTAARILETSGLPVTVVKEGDTITALAFDHVWCEAYIRTLGISEWKALDPTFKSYTLLRGRNIAAEAGLRGATFWGEVQPLISADPATGQLSRVDLEGLSGLLRVRRERVLNFLRDRAPTLTLNQVIGGRRIVPQTVRGLPSRPSYPGVGATARFETVAAEEKLSLRLSLSAGFLDGGVRLSTTLAVPEIAHRKITVVFVPADAKEAAKISAAGGLLNVAPGSVKLRAQVRLDGVTAAEAFGTTTVGMRLSLNVRMMRGRNEVDEDTYPQLTAGGIYSLVLNSQSIPRERFQGSLTRLRAAVKAGKPVLGDEMLGELLNTLGLGYQRYKDLTADYLAGTQNAVYFKHLSHTLIHQDVVADRTVQPARMALEGYIVDDKRHSRFFVDRAGSPSFDPFALRLMSGSCASTFEQFLFGVVGWPGASTTRVLREAAENDVPILNIGPENVDLLLPTLSVALTWKKQIEAEVKQGRRVVVPQRQLTINHWTGIGWQSYDPATGFPSDRITPDLNGGASVLGLLGLSGTEQLATRLLDALEALANGFFIGDFNRTGYDDPLLERSRNLGQFLSGLINFGDLRDLLAHAKLLLDTNGQEGGAEFILDVVAIVLPGLGDGLKAARIAERAGEAALGSKRSMQILGEVAGENAGRVAAGAARNADDIVGEAARGRLGGVATAEFKAVHNGIAADHIVVRDGKALLTQAKVPVGDGGNLNRALAGERLTDVVAEKRGWTRVDVKIRPNAQGVDRVYQTPNGDYVLVEAKFIEGNRNLSSSSLDTTVGGQPQKELTNEWLAGNPANDALARSVREGSITQAQANEIREAIQNNRVKREIVVVVNNHNGRTISSGIGNDPQLKGVGATVVHLPPNTLPPAKSSPTGFRIFVAAATSRWLRGGAPPRGPPERLLVATPRGGLV